MKKATIRIEDTIASAIQVQMGNMTAGATYMLEAYYYVRQHGLKEIKSMFTPTELKLMLDAENGVLFSPRMIQGFILHIRDAISIERLAEKWGVDGDKLIAKLEACPLSRIVILEEWLNYYWYGKHKKKPTIDEYIA